MTVEDFCPFCGVAVELHDEDRADCEMAERKSRLLEESALFLGQGASVGRVGHRGY